jgi:multimeric flavodoxin WrbA
MGPAKDLLIVYHSQSGTTEQLAAAVEQGAHRVTGMTIRRLRAGEVDAERLSGCQTLVICSPEYFGYMAGAVKDLFDRTYEAVRENTIGKPYALVIAAGNDGNGALQSMERILLGYRMKRVQEPIIHRGTLTEAVLQQCRELGQTLAAGMELGIY